MARSKSDLGEGEGDEEKDEITRVEGAGGEAEPLRDFVAENDHHAEGDDSDRCVGEERAEREGVGDVRGRASEPRGQVHVSVDGMTKRSREVSEHVET